MGDDDKGWEIDKEDILRMNNIKGIGQKARGNTLLERSLEWGLVCLVLNVSSQCFEVGSTSIY